MSDPYPGYAALREADPVRFDASTGVWTVTRHADCTTVLRDRRFSAELAQRRRRRRDELPASMLTRDPPEHARLRAPVARAFDQRSTEGIGRRIVSTAEETLARLRDREESELLGELVRPLVTAAFLELLGIPPAEAGPLNALIEDASLGLDPLATPDWQDRAASASADLSTYFEGLLADRRRSPGSGVVSALSGPDVAACLTDHEIVAACKLLVIGGHDPTVHLIGNALHALMNHPDQLTLLRHDVSLLATAVEECMRYDSPIQMTARVAREDITLSGRTVLTGALVIAFLGAANRDPDVFDAPDRLDLARSPNPHLAFGHGVHHCLGARLAREIAHGALTALVAGRYELVLAGEAEWCDTLVPRGLRRLPVNVLTLGGAGV